MASLLLFSIFYEVSCHRLHALRHLDGKGSAALDTFRLCRLVAPLHTFSVKIEFVATASRTLKPILKLHTFHLTSFNVCILYPP